MNCSWVTEYVNSIEHWLTLFMSCTWKMSLLYKRKQGYMKEKNSEAFILEDILLDSS